jgi:carbonic anhydrase
MIKKKREQGRFLIIRNAFYLFSILILTGCVLEKHDLFDKKNQQKMSPGQVLQDLIAGNKRSCSNVRLKRGSLQAKGAQASRVGQSPKAVILACMDSRSIPEIVFDQSIADIFTLRVAGNVVNKDMLASMEYATKHVGTRLIVIMGHTHCGAIKAACKDVQGGNLAYVLDAIQPAVKAKKYKSKQYSLCDDTSVITEIASQNVANMMQVVLQESTIIRDMIARKEIAMVGAIHDLESGIVTFKFSKGLDL